MNNVINVLNSTSNTSVNVLNEGQLDFALEKSRMSIRGRELYPKLYQKAAVLMETLCKSHTLTDGNKRASFMAAEHLANVNGAILVVPLKAARLAVDCAMDADDKMSGEIAAWFKAHIARDELELSVMLEELVEERDIVAALFDQRRYDEAERVVDGWLAFDSHPESRKAWSRLVEKRREEDEAQQHDPLASRPYFSPWLSLSGGLHVDYMMPRFSLLPEARIDSPLYAGHGLKEMEGAGAHIGRSVERLRDPSCGAGALWNAGMTLENLGHYKAAVRVYDRLLEADGSDPKHVLSRKLVNLVFAERYEEARAVVDRLAGQASAARRR